MERAEFEIAWICALPIELAAAQCMFDEILPILNQPIPDTNLYCCGRIGQHKVLVTCSRKLSGIAQTVPSLTRSFPNVTLLMMVGIGAGIPNLDASRTRDVRLGDVVVGEPNFNHGGVIYLDLNRTSLSNKLWRVGHLRPPPPAFSDALVSLKSTHMLQGSKIRQYLSDMSIKYPKIRSQFLYPGPEQDLLFEASYEHPQHSATCLSCDTSKLVQRPNRVDNSPVVHYGTIASSNKVLRHGGTRDKLAGMENILCFETEAMGIMNSSLPFLVIRGVCDYADSHQNKQWQPYAAAVAAAYAKEVLNSMPSHYDASPAASITSEVTIALSSTSTSVETKAAAHELLLLLQTHDGLKEIFKNASNVQNMSSSRFESKIRRSLKSLATNLQEEARTNMQRAIIRLISSQARTLAKELGKPHFPLEVVSLDNQLQQIRTTEGKPDHLDRWLKNKFGGELQQTGISSTEPTEYESDSGEDDMTDQDQSLSSLLAVREFLLSSVAFAKFIASLREWASEKEQSTSKSGSERVWEEKEADGEREIGRNIEQSITQTRYKCIWDEIIIEWEQEVGWHIPWDAKSFLSSRLRVDENLGISHFDGVKMAFESFTGDPWDWWPLSPPKPGVSVGCVRIKWSRPAWRSRCVDVSPSFAVKILTLHNDLSIEQLSRGRDSSALDPTLKKAAGAVSLSNVQQPLAALPTSSSDPTAQQGVASQQTPSPASGSRQSGNAQQGTSLQNNQPSSQAPQNPLQPSVQLPFGTNISQQGYQSPGTGGTNFQNFHILLCVPRGRQLHYGIISSPGCDGGKIICDDAFFKELRKHYRQLRGFWRYWFFPRQFDHCHGWRFMKDPPKLFGLHLEFPSAHPYEIDPSPPKTPYQSPLSADLWYTRFYNQPRWYTLLFHRLSFKKTQHIHGSKFLAKLPKRTTEFELQEDSSEEHVWGLQAHLRLSLVYVLVWQIVLMLGGLAFYVWWLIKHPGDQQNAIVPWTVIIGAFLFFWTPLSSSFES